MRKMGVLLLVLMILSMVSCTETSFTPTATEVAQAAQVDTAETAARSVPIPKVSYFQEKRTIAKWAERWDQPSIPCYVYLFSYGNCIGYYVTDGKPASTRSYLMPEEQIVDDPHGSYDAGGQLIGAPDIDGTYGENNPGIRFFTASGVAVEWAGDGATYLYSDSPLSLNVPLLHK